tara:strand:+ start:739 stop:1689 length:951 start_codon:yes stop_codon:yes gene_type:complete
MKRKKFIKLASTGALGISSLGYLSCENQKQIFFKLSLAQWSLNKQIKSGETSPYLFAEIAKELGFTGLEYVNQLYDDVMLSQNKSSSIKNFISKSNQLALDNGMENVLIMIDHEGDLADENRDSRLKSVDNHKLWADTAAEMGCSSIRVNLHGSKDKVKWKDLSMDSLYKLCQHAKEMNLNIVVENHGELSSNIPVLMDVINGVNMSNCGTLPDFGNFCVAVEGYGSIFTGECADVYDLYKGVEEMMPKAFAVSAKSNDFDTKGDEKTIDYKRMLEIVNRFGYTGYIGVEYEGSRLSEIDGIKATKDLLIKIGQSI